MLVLRLSRTGRKNYATYRVVAADSRRAATGKVVANLGHYNPHSKELSLKKTELERYMQNGAQPSGAVIRLLKKEGIAVPTWAAKNLVVKKPKPKEAPPASEVSTETPSEEAEVEAKAAVDAKDEAEANVEENQDQDASAPVSDKTVEEPTTAPAADDSKEKA